MQLKPTILSNLSLYFRSQGLQLFDYVTITKAESDRAWGWPTPKLREFTRTWTHDPNWIGDQMHGDGTYSVREPNAVMPCMQICYHKSPSFQPDEEGPEFVEIDFDFASPLGGDLASLLAHAWEVVWNFLSGSLTPQAKIERMLQKRFSQVLR